MGNRTAVIETIRQPGALAGVMAFLEENGLPSPRGQAVPGVNLRVVVVGKRPFCV
ncbi:MAG: hypothetical protein GY805_30005 [Chloroflexi bacterium]|nr:hypothetical protein [Chloroflexota bacterium]